MFGMIAKLKHDGAFRSREWGVNPTVENSPPGFSACRARADLQVFRCGASVRIDGEPASAGSGYGEFTVWAMGNDPSSESWLLRSKAEGAAIA